MPLRVPTEGTLDDLIHKHKEFLARLSDNGFKPVPPLKVFALHGYRRDKEPFHRPYRVFKLLNNDNTTFRYPQSKLIHITGMVRHLAIELMKKCPPDRLPDEFKNLDPADWVRSYVAGHGDKESTVPHRQFSYLPLPSIGHVHTDPGVRRVMIVAPLGDDLLLNHLARLLAGRRLVPTSETKLENPPVLVRDDHDKKVVPFYTKPSANWASVTPVILPGYLQNNTAVHLKLRFKDGNDEIKVPGPLAIGAGRHCGLGLFAAISDD